MEYKKSAISGEYMVGVRESGSIEVYRVYDNVKGALREIAEKEGFDKTNFSGSFYTDDEYPGCPYCGAKKCFICGSCGKVNCYDGTDKVHCNWCGAGGTAYNDDSKMDVTGGGY